MPPKFQRTKFRAYIKLGLRQKSLRRYKRPTGRHNKIRQKWKGRPCMVEVGYKNESAGRNLVNGKVPVLVYNLKDLAKVGKNNIVMLGKIGNKNKLEIAKEAINKKMDVFNLNITKFVKKMTKKGEKKNGTK